MLFIVIGLGVLYFWVEIIQCKHEELKKKIMMRISNIPIGYQDSVIEGFLDDLPEKEIRLLASMNDKKLKEYICAELQGKKH